MIFGVRPKISESTGGAGGVPPISPLVCPIAEKLGPTRFVIGRLEEGVFEKSAELIVSGCQICYTQSMTKLRTDEFDYQLPSDLIAQTPVEPRDASRLMVVERANGAIAHRRFRDLLDYLRPGDIMVANDSRVFRARLFGRKATGGRVEILLLKPLGDGRWEVLVGGRRVRVDTELHFEKAGIQLTGRVVEELSEARRVVEFDQAVTRLLDELGEAPLPPYIHEPLGDPERYQTVFGRVEGSAAAPTAGLHFTPEMLLALRERGVILAFVTLHIGLDTFKPVTTEYVTDHSIHSEWASLTPEVAQQINQAKLAGGRLVAVGTTAVRTLETAALRSAGVTGSLRQASQLQVDLCPWRPVAAFENATDLFIYPGFRFRAVDVLLTNYHLPKSSLLMLISAFAGPELVRRAYQIAITQRYRFFSFGDVMLIL
jgi:S-adenosylmethionine:tRNA ribosyltransferase-isomerase